MNCRVRIRFNFSSQNTHLVVCGPGYRSRYSGSLRAGRSGDRIPVGGKIFRTRPDRSCGPPSLLYNEYRVSFPGVRRPGRGVGHPPISSAEIKKGVELYLHSRLCAFIACSRLNCRLQLKCDDTVTHRRGSEGETGEWSG